MFVCVCMHVCMCVLCVHDIICDVSLCYRVS